MMQTSRLFIGMPVFNGEQFIGKAIESIIAQTYQNWELLVSDNCSTDRTAEICKEFAAKEPRINFFKHDTNGGPLRNFLYVLDKCDTDYFMWAAADDMWDRKFIECCLPPLINRKEFGFSFCNINNIDSFGCVIRDYPSFERFITHDKASQIASFIMDPEYFGKANIFYSIYRLSTCKGIIMELLKMNMLVWGSDMAFTLGILLQTDLFISDKILFHKRLSLPTDTIEAPKKITVEHSYVDGIPLAPGDYEPYFNLILHVSAKSPHAALISSLIAYRRELANDLNGYNQKINAKRILADPPAGIKKLSSLLAKAIVNKIG